MGLPTLDFSKASNGTETERLQVCQELVASLKDHGFVKLVNHGVPDEVVQSYLDATKAIFALPQAAKDKILNIRGPFPQRGWSHVGAEQTSKLWKGNLSGKDNGDDLTDEREHFDAGPPQDSQYPNKWPSENLPEFQPLMEKCYAIFQDVSLRIVAAIEVGADLPENALVQRCIPAASEIRLNHYPPVSLARLREGKVKRTWPHTDFGIITLLFQDNVGGLELEDRSNPGTFLPVPPRSQDGPSEMVVNISDTFQRWTNNVFQAGLHQVTIPPEMKGKDEGVCPDRHSSIFFFKADRNTSVGPLPYFVSDERVAAYDEVTALEFQQRMTQKLY